MKNFIGRPSVILSVCLFMRLVTACLQLVPNQAVQGITRDVASSEGGFFKIMSRTDFMTSRLDCSESYRLINGATGSVVPDATGIRINNEGDVLIDNTATLSLTLRIEIT